MKGEPQWTRLLKASGFVLVYTCATLLVFWYLWTPINGGLLTFKYDPVHEYWADLKFQYETLSNGTIALWNPHDRGGFPVYGDPQPGLLYPVTWFLLLIATVVGDVPYWLMEFKVVLHWILGAVGMHLFLRRQQLSEPCAYIGGTLFVFTAPAIRYGGNALNWTYSWIPWVLLATWYFSEKPNQKRSIILGCTVATAFLSGAPAMFWYLLLMAIPYGIYRMWGELKTSWRPTASAGGVSLALVLPLLLGNAEQLGSSVRDTRDISFITHSAFQPAHLLNLVVPGIGGEIIYYSVLGLIAIAAAWMAQANRLMRLFAIIAAGGVLLALGHRAGILPSLASLLPPFTGFRQAHRYLYITSAAMAIAVPLAIHTLQTSDAEQRDRLKKFVTLSLGAVTFGLFIGVVVNVAAADKLPSSRTDALVWALAAAAIYLAIARSILSPKTTSRTAASWSLVVVLFLDIWIVNYKSHKQGLAGKPNTTNDSILEGLALDPLHERIHDDGKLQCRPGTRLGIRDFSGYEDDPLRLKRYDLFRNAARRTPDLLGHAGVRYYIAGRKRLIRSPPSHTKINSHVSELNEVAPAIFYVASPVVAKDAKAALTMLTKITPGYQAVIEGEPAVNPNRPVAEETPIVGRFTHYSPNRIEVTIETPAPGYIVIAEAYFPSWHATVDGQSTKILPANVLFRAVPVSSAGRHAITMEIQAPGYRWSLYFALGLWLTFAVYGVVVLVKRRRAASS